MAFDGRANIVEIDDDERIVAFDLYRKKKISGTKLGPILGMSDLSTPFKVALELAGIYPGDKANKYIDAGNILEPVIRSYVRTRRPCAPIWDFPRGPTSSSRNRWRRRSADTTTSTTTRSSEAWWTDT